MPSVPSRDDTSTARTSEPNDGARVEAGGGSYASRPWWETKTLEELTPTEWEALCDGCGRCCLVKLEDEDTGEILHTDIGCKLFDAGTCRCSDYPRRHRKVADCIALNPAQVRALRWLPGTCAYRLVAEGNSLRDWHPLVSGSPESVHEAGISVRGRIGGNERHVKLRDYVDHIIVWDELSPSP